MSTIDLGNPQVLKNYVKSKVKEGQGKFHEEEKVLMFTDKDGNQFVVPSEIREEMEVKFEKKKEEKKAKKEAKKEKKIIK